MKRKISSILGVVALAALLVSPIMSARLQQTEAQKAQAEAIILQKLASYPPKATLISIPTLRWKLAKQLDREQFDDALKSLAGKSAVKLYQSDFLDQVSDEEKAEMLKIGDDYFHGVSRPRK
jgi:hypothetical protein